MGYRRRRANGTRVTVGGERAVGIGGICCSIIHGKIYLMGKRHTWRPVDTKYQFLVCLFDRFLFLDS